MPTSGPPTRFAATPEQQAGMHTVALRVSAAAPTARPAQPDAGDAARGLLQEHGANSCQATLPWAEGPDAERYLRCVPIKMAVVCAEVLC